MNIVYSADANWYKSWFRFELLLELSKLGHRVSYVAPQRISQFIANLGKKKVQRNISYDSVNYLPYLRVSKKHRFFELDLLIKQIRQLKSDQTVFISNDYKRCDAVKNYFKDQVIVVYDMYDRYSEYGNENYTKPQRRIEEFDTSERALIAKCDLLLCASITLAEETKRNNHSVLWFPNAVPKDYIKSNDSKKRYKKIGMLSDRMSRIDQKLLLEIAETMVDYKIELIGKNDANNGIKYPANIVFKEYMSHNELLEYITNWDCGLALYTSDRFNYYCCPMKYFEYASRNLPVITTPIPEGRIFANEYPDSIYLAGNRTEFIQQVKKIEAMPGNYDFTQLAAENTWEIRARQLIKSLKRLMVK